MTRGEAERSRCSTLLAKARKVGGAMLRRLVCIHTIDVVGRSTATAPPTVRCDPQLVLHQVTSLDSVVGAAPGQRDWPIIDLVARIRPLGRRLRARRRERNAERLAKGDLAYVATAGADVAAWIWVSREPSVHCRWSGLHFSLEPDEAYIYDLWSFPAHRATGAGAFVMQGLLEDLRRRGEVSRVYGYILRDNRPNQVLTRVVFGFEQVQRVKDLRVLSRLAWQLPFTEDPRVGPCSRPPLASRRRPRGGAVYSADSARLS
ncbi:MAG: hypothetical protein JWM02_1857 [Frankiales bacterium]|nr:hypothetical protein [Frankiales bacterium]